MGWILVDFAGVVDLGGWPQQVAAGASGLEAVVEVHWRLVAVMNSI